MTCSDVEPDEERPAMTHTYAILTISQAAFDEILQQLKAAAYHHAIDDPDGSVVTIDMQGIALQARPDASG